MVPNDAPCIILNDVSSYVFAYQIDKKGHIFANDDLPVEWIEDMIKRFGVRYMYSDSRKINENPRVQGLVDSLLFQSGSLQVVKLKAPK